MAAGRCSNQIECQIVPEQSKFLLATKFAALKKYSTIYERNKMYKNNIWNK